MFLSQMPCFKTFTAIYFLKEQFLKLKSRAYINAYGFGNSQIYFFFFSSVFSTKLQIYTNLPAREPKPANSMLFSLTGFISSFHIQVVSWYSVLPSVLNHPMAQQSTETTLGFNSTPPSPDLAQLPARLPKLGVYHGLLFHQSGWFFCLCSSLMPLTLHLDIFQVHFGNNVQVSVMERTQFT